MDKIKHPWGVMKPGEFRWYDADEADKAVNSIRSWAAMNKRRFSVERLDGGSVIITARAGQTWRSSKRLTRAGR
jgi:hypothetical protein